tara:strand:- start:43 stop:1125 length:1083 start_codon:yes stop_codon:yes gene_type:complete
MKHHVLKFSIFFCALLLVGQGCVSGGAQEPKTSGPGGIFVSLDKAETWQPIASFPTLEGVMNLADTSVSKLVSDPHNEKTHYWLSRGKGLFITHNNGKSWYQEEGAFSTGFVYGLVVHPKEPCTLYAVKRTALYQSVDCARSWSMVYKEEAGDRLKSVAIDSGFPHSTYLATEKGRVLVSEDRGISWQTARRFRNAKLVGLHADPSTPRRLYLTTRKRGIFVTEDGGATWKSLFDEKTTKLPKVLEYRRFLIHPQDHNVLFYVSTYGILRSDNFGESWEKITLLHEPGSVKIYAFTVDPKNTKELYYTATVGVKSTLYKSVDGGVSWITKQLPSGQIPTMLQTHRTEEGWVYLGFTIPAQ